MSTSVKQKAPLLLRLAEADYPQIIETMLRDRVNLLQAATLLGFSETPSSAFGHSRRKSFQELHVLMSRSHFAALGSNFDTDKRVLIGMFMDDAKRLRDMGKPKEASEVIEKAGKMLGYVGADSTVNIFQDMSGADLQRAIEKVRERRNIM